MLFDEATAALDAENEAAIVEAMHELARDRTVIAIAHRLSSIAAADQVCVLEKGCITQQGTHGDLVKVPGRYRSFWRERQQAAVGGWPASPVALRIRSGAFGAGTSDEPRHAKRMGKRGRYGTFAL